MTNTQITDKQATTFLVAKCTVQANNHNEEYINPIERLRSGEDLYFVSYRDTAEIRWVRSPLLTLGEVALLTFELFSKDAKIERFNVYSEEELNIIDKVYDETNGCWIDGHFTRRERLFDDRYQDYYEIACELAGVNLDVVKKAQEARERYATLVTNHKRKNAASQQEEAA